MNKYLIIGAACAGVVLAFAAKKAAVQAVETVKDVAYAVNPLNEDNVINKTVTSVYQSATGSTGTIGTDLYDANHGGVLTDVSWWQWANPGAALGQVASTAIDQYHVVDNIKNWWENL
jgi:hypothetical protein